MLQKTILNIRKKSYLIFKSTWISATQTGGQLHIYKQKAQYKHKPLFSQGKLQHPPTEFYSNIQTPTESPTDPCHGRVPTFPAGVGPATTSLPDANNQEPTHMMWHLLTSKYSSTLLSGHRGGEGRFSLTP